MIKEGREKEYAWRRVRESRGVEMKSRREGGGLTCSNDIPPNMRILLFSIALKQSNK